MNMKNVSDTNSERGIRRLKKYYPTIFKNIYEKTESTFNMSVSILENNISYSKPVYNYEYVNSYKVREIAVGASSMQEYVFSCPVMDRRSGIIEEYFISREYKLDAVDENRSSSYFGVRFIFSYSLRKNLVIHSMAEEPAVHFKSTIVNVEEQYTFRREFHEPGKYGLPRICIFKIKL